MDKMQILVQLQTCIDIVKGADNIYVSKHLEEISKALVEQWNTEDIYMQEIKNVLDYDETMENLNNLKIR